MDINGLKNFNKEFGREYGDEVVIRVGEVLEEYFSRRYGIPPDRGRIPGNHGERGIMRTFINNVHGAHSKLENISLGLTTMGYAWEKVDIDVDSLVAHAEGMMREEKQKYYKNLKKGHHEPIIKQDLLEDIEQGEFYCVSCPQGRCSDTEEVVGAEAVVRYHHKDLGIVDPGKYHYTAGGDKAVSSSGSVCVRGGL